MNIIEPGTRQELIIAALFLERVAATLKADYSPDDKWEEKDAKGRYDEALRLASTVRQIANSDRK